MQSISCLAGVVYFTALNSYLLANTLVCDANILKSGKAQAERQTASILPFRVIANKGSLVFFFI